MPRIKITGLKVLRNRIWNNLIDEFGMRRIKIGKKRDLEGKFNYKNRYSISMKLFIDKDYLYLNYKISYHAMLILKMILYVIITIFLSYLINTIYYHVSTLYLTDIQNNKPILFVILIYFFAGFFIIGKFLYVFTPNPYYSKFKDIKYIIKKSVDHVKSITIK